MTLFVNKANTIKLPGVYLTLVH